MGSCEVSATIPLDAGKVIDVAVVPASKVVEPSVKVPNAPVPVV